MNVASRICAGIEIDDSIMTDCERSVIADGRLGHTKAPASEATAWILEWLVDGGMTRAANELVELPIGSEAWVHAIRYWARQRALGNKLFSTTWWQCVYLRAHYQEKPGA